MGRVSEQMGVEVIKQNGREVRWQEGSLLVRGGQGRTGARSVFPGKGVLF